VLLIVDMKQEFLLLLIVVGIVGGVIGYNFAKHSGSALNESYTVKAIAPSPSSYVAQDTVTPTDFSPSPTPLPSSDPTWNIPSSTTPTTTTSNATTGGPQNDIVEITPLTADQKSAQVDDPVTFTTTLQNQGTRTRNLAYVCFESNTNNNFGCAWNISLVPGQIQVVTNTAHFTHGGKTRVWIDWTQDYINYYTPRHAKSVTVNIQG